jgi:hypothetical protein
VCAASANKCFTTSKRSSKQVRAHLGLSVSDSSCPCAALPSSVLRAQTPAHHKADAIKYAAKGVDGCQRKHARVVVVATATKAGHSCTCDAPRQWRDAGFRTARAGERFLTQADEYVALRSWSAFDVCASAEMTRSWRRPAQTDRTESGRKRKRHTLAKKEIGSLQHKRGRSKRRKGIKGFLTMQTPAADEKEKAEREQAVSQHKRPSASRTLTIK